MDEKQIFDELAALIREYFDDESLEITPETGPETIEDWDSLAHIGLIVSVEKHFGVKFPMNEVLTLKTVGKLCGAVKRLL